MTAVPAAGRPPRWAGVAAAVFYGVSSGSMSFINKVVLSSFGFQFPCFIMLSQMIFTAALLRCLSFTGQLSLPAATLSNLKICRVPSILGLFHSVMSLHALSGMNVTMYTVLKRCVPLMNLLLMPCFLQIGVPSLSIVGSISLMTAGCIFTGLGDLSFDLAAYTFGIMSVFSQSLYLTLVQSIGLQNDTLTAAGITYLNSLNSLLPLFICTAVASEFTQVLDFEDLYSAPFLLSFFLVISVGCVLNYSVFLCTTLTSALTTSVTGVIKSTVVVMVGLSIFDSVELTLLSATGITLNTCGSGWYAYAKYQEKSIIVADVVSKSQDFVSDCKPGDNHVMNGLVFTGIKVK